MFKKFALVLALLTLVVPAFAQSTVIDAGNAFDMEELVRLGRGEVHNAQFSVGGGQIIVGSSVGVWVYEESALDTVAEPTLAATTEEAEIVALSPDGELILVAQSDILQIWGGGEVIAEIDTDSFIQSIEVSPDNEYVVTGHSDDTIKIWTDPEGDPVVGEGHGNDPNDIAISPDSSVIASGSDDDTVRLWDTDGTELAVIETGSDINVLEFLPDGSAIVTGDDNGVMSVWDAATGELIMAFEEAAHTQAIRSIAVNPEGTLVATGSWDDDIRVWDLAEMEQRSVGSGEDAEAWIQPEKGDIIWLDFSVDGSAIVAVGQDEFVGLFDIATRDVLAEAVGHTDGMQALDFNPDGSLLTFSDDDGDVWIWEVGSGAEITEIPHIEEIGTFSGDNETGLVYSPDGAYIVVESSFEVTQIDATTGETINVLDGEPFANSVAVSPDSSLIAYAGSDGLFVFNANSGLIVAQISTHTLRLNHLEFNPEQTMIATASDDGTVRIYGLPE